MLEIYYVEDDNSIAQTVKNYLEQKNYHVILFPTITEVKKALLSHIPALILLDWNMPDGQGDLLCRWIRMKWQELPIIFLTVRDDARDMISGFQSGADDYVVKPFELGVLHSRIVALLRRAGNVSEQYLSCDLISIDQNRMIAFYNEEEIPLSRPEYHLLSLLLRNKGKTLTRERILSQVWDSNGSYVNDNTLTVTMKRLREKLGQPSCIKTVRSFGYRMEDRV